MRDSEDYAREPRGGASLTDVLVAANMIVVHFGQPPEFLQARLQTVRAISRLELTREICESLLNRILRRDRCASRSTGLAVGVLIG